MSDLYSVLRETILERNLRSPAARKEVYAQARTAVTRQLWTYDPPLSEGEITDRVSEFDHAVVSIEEDLARTFAKQPAPPRLTNRSRQKPPRKPERNAPVMEGYDEEADYTPAVSARPEPEPPARRGNERARPPARFAEEIEQALAERSAAIENALRAEHGDAPEAEPLAGDVAGDYADPDEPYEAARPPQNRFLAAYRQGRPDERADYPPPEEERYADDQAYDAPAYEDDQTYAGDEYQEDEATTRREDAREARRRSVGSGRGWAPTVGFPKLNWTPWAEWSERNRIIALLSAIGGLVVMLTILALVLFSGSSPAPKPISASAGPTAAVGVKSADAVDSFVIFDGRDPTVFQAAGGNPIRFEGDTSGGFARVASSASDAGVRVAIGPGLAGRLAGKNIRLTLVARAARENGATGLRFAYQSGVAFSHWQTANLAAGYSDLALTWRVPAQRTDPTGDYILIEPGIPGDGTGADIRAIRIELLS